MKRPVIGIPQCLDDRGRWREGRRYLYIDHAYARAVEGAGGLPLHLPIQSDAGALVERIDGLLLPGGDDFLPPSPYPEDATFDPAPDEQVEFDSHLLGAALRRQLPVLGICYGMQLLALIRGASLHYHLPHDRPDAEPHQLEDSPDPASPETGHEIEIESDSRLASAMGSGVTRVNSLHHQALATPGIGMRVVARSPDGVIEAIEAEGATFIVGVQWHPEKLFDAGRPLFEAFVAACAAPAEAPTLG